MPTEVAPAKGDGKPSEWIFDATDPYFHKADYEDVYGNFPHPVLIPFSLFGSCYKICHILCSCLLAVLIGFPAMCICGCWTASQNMCFYFCCRPCLKSCKPIKDCITFLVKWFCSGFCYILKMLVSMSAEICGAGSKCCCACVLIFTACCPMCGGQKRGEISVNDWLDLEAKDVGSPVKMAVMSEERY
jgi:hypothetical protein